MDTVAPVRAARPDTSAPAVAVVGSDGFIGRRLSGSLIARGTVVHGYTRQRGLHQQAATGGPAVIFYLATSVTPALAEQHPELVTADHARFAALVRMLARTPDPPMVVLTSSAGTVYDPDLPGPYREDLPTRATSRYGAAKLALEQLLLDHCDTIPTVILRLSNVYGPGQRVDRSQGVLAYWLRAAAAGEPLTLIGDPDTTRDYVYVDDVVDCMLRLPARLGATAGVPPVILNVGSGVSTPLADLLTAVRAVVGGDLPVRRLPPRPVDRRDVLLDVGRAHRLLGWRSRTTLADGITAMWRATPNRRPPPDPGTSAVPPPRASHDDERQTDAR
ncbi:NAD-dependent epimerase/dehydratase family protein [Solwaraspora sp. WMMD791]|uniref:NAD-dependent epimerase/dehydratase family protein n=1 Tax=Solwaraspora sp. WMMD791 TaxID=3016086 RepID=UPI00249CAF31|nr:NAD-dependent epimerase/dehydratase family protein [Solwaraspora sp. WMMD791]WFE29222.1 NAD-dependent epimerase/dehydratase family protein [Solwaraspora sp. WMMD791]